MDITENKDGSIDIELSTGKKFNLVESSDQEGLVVEKLEHSWYKELVLFPREKNKLEIQ